MGQMWVCRRDGGYMGTGWRLREFDDLGLMAIMVILLMNKIVIIKILVLDNFDFQ